MEAKPAFVSCDWGGQLGLADRFYFPMYLTSRKTRKFIIDSPLGAGEVAQWAEFLHQKHKDLSSNPQRSHKKPTW